MQDTLEVEGLTVRFGGLVAVNDVSFKIGANEIVGLIGPNGAGKTTIFNSICGVTQTAAGLINLGSESLVGKTNAQIASLGVSRTFQNVRLFAELSVRDNIIMGAYRTHKCGFVSSALRSPQHAKIEKESGEVADHWIDRLGLRNFADRSAASLPLGIQRVVEVARAMAGAPKLVLLDEPAAGLNAIEKERLAAIVKQIAVEKCAVLVVEHDMTMVMPLVDRLIVINFGFKIADGAVADVSRSAVVQEAYLGV
ncbi:ABC transporter ATP-binding protein [Roseiarcaceae bacterium H3SJ34-1]|uniref:ABC transporter ATP-binding protein n=1 Tax=Terripilifer ovatus TaxID=3032367 RepID=UPI003AB96959|nr:ABC transporter ATP-binding protein [Roseiarcaceae bacterium H3SJ34-1]